MVDTQHFNAEIEPFKYTVNIDIKYSTLKKWGIRLKNKFSTCFLLENYCLILQDV